MPRSFICFHYILASTVVTLVAGPSGAQLIQWNPTTISSSWLTSSNWVGGFVPGEVNNSTSQNLKTATFGNYSTTVAAVGVGIDMGAAGGFLALGAIDFNPTSATSSLVIGNSSTNSAGTLILNTAGVYPWNDLLIAVRGNQDLTIQDRQGLGNQSLTLQLGNYSGRFVANAGRTLTVNVPIAERQPGYGLIIDGGGTVVFGRANSFTGSVTVIGQSTLLLDFRGPLAPSANILSAAGTVTLGSTGALNGTVSSNYTATLSAVGAARTLNTQTLSGFSLQAPGVMISATSGAGGSMTLNLGPLQGTIPINAVAQFNLPATGAITTSFGTAGNLLTNGGAPFATVGTGEWAVKDTANSAVVPGAAVTGFYTPSTTSTLSGNADVAPGVDTTLTGSTTITTLRFNLAQARTVTVGAGNALTVTGILVTDAVGNNPSVIAGGSLRASGTNLAVFQHNTANVLTIGSAITAGNLIKAGAGTLVLTGANTYSGGTYIQAGTLWAGAPNTFSPNSIVYMSRMTVMELAGFNETVAGLTFSPGPTNPTDPVIQNGAATPAILSVGSSVNTNWGGSIQDGAAGTLTLNKVGTGRILFAGSMTYTGGTTVSAGTLYSGTGLGPGLVTVGIGTFQASTTPTLIADNGLNSPVTVTAFGAIEPSLTNIGSMTVTKSVTFQPSSLLNVKVNGTSTSDNLKVTGSTSVLNFQFVGGIGPTVVLKNGPGTPFNSGTPSSYKIASFTGGATLDLNGMPVVDGAILGQFVVGGVSSGPVTIDPSAFSGMQNGATFTLTRSGTDVVLAFFPVPEPACMFGWTTSFGAFAWVVRRLTRRKEPAAFETDGTLEGKRSSSWTELDKSFSYTAAPLPAKRM
jgi:fibronectin-binding autotransporter adhesin